MPPTLPPALPPLARLLGIAGLLPFVGLMLAVFLTQGWTRGLALQALAAYGAVILGFLGAVHWGFALATPDAGARVPRLAGGVLPSLWAWGALAGLPPSLACIALAVGLALTLVAEEVALARGLTPRGYQGLRRLLTAVAGACLAAAAVVALG
jgi:hypothetical protein